MQNGDDSLLSLASRYASALATPYQEVLQQLEDLRLAEWSDHAPPPPPPLNNSAAAAAAAAAVAAAAAGSGGGQPNNYVNYPISRRGAVVIRQGEEPIYVPGQYQVGTAGPKYTLFTGMGACCYPSTRTNVAVFTLALKLSDRA